MASSTGAARPSSPSNSFYALSDDEEGDYNTITETTSGRGVKLLYSKSKVKDGNSNGDSAAFYKVTRGRFIY